jgi:hypothetical protein
VLETGRRARIPEPMQLARQFRSETGRDQSEARRQ